MRVRTFSQEFGSHIKPQNNQTIIQIFFLSGRHGKVNTAKEAVCESWVLVIPKRDKF